MYDGNGIRVPVTVLQVRFAFSCVIRSRPSVFSSQLENCQVTANIKTVRPDQTEYRNRRGLQMVNCAKGVEYLHGVKLVHEDLKGVRQILSKDLPISSTHPTLIHRRTFSSPPITPSALV